MAGDCVIVNFSFEDDGSTVSEGTLPLGLMTR